MENIQELSIEDIIDSATDQNLEEANQALFMEVVDRIKNSSHE